MVLLSAVAFLFILIRKYKKGGHTIQKSSIQRNIKAINIWILITSVVLLGLLTFFFIEYFNHSIKFIEILSCLPLTVILITLLFVRTTSIKKRTL